MKKILTIIVLSLCFIIPSQADDIRDFQIEGMSIGDSLLDFFSEKEIKKFRNYDDLPSDMKFRIAEFDKNRPMRMKIYGGIQLFYKPNDNKYKIYSLSGFINCSTKSICESKFKEIENDLRKVFYSIKPGKGLLKHPDDKSGESTYRYVDFAVKGGFITVSHYDWSNKVSYPDSVRVNVSTIEAKNWAGSNYGVD